MEQAAKTAQERFNETYITSSEICKELDVTRASVLSARRRGLLPDPVLAQDGVPVYLWERATVTPYLEAWKRILGVRRSARA